MGKITKEMIERVPRKNANELLAKVPAATPATILAVEIALNNEWWRGYFAGRDDQRTDGQSKDVIK